MNARKVLTPLRGEVMNWKSICVIVLAGTIVFALTPNTPAHGLRGSGAASYCDCMPPCPPPCAPAAPVTRKVLVTEFYPEEYEATVKVWKTFSKEETYKTTRCEMVPVEKTRTVTYYKMVPKTVETTVTKCEWVTEMQDRVVVRYECEVTMEDRDVTHWVTKSIPVTTEVTRCVDKGGHYECREVPCPSSGGTSSRGLFHRRRGCGNDCGCECAPAMMVVSVYVPNIVAEKVQVTVMQTKCEAVTEKVKVPVRHLVEKKETVKVPVCRLVETKVPVKVTVNECVAVPTEEKYTVWQANMVPVEAKRMVCWCEPVDQKVKAVRWIPKTVEKEVVCAPPPPCGDCGGYSDCGGGGRRCGLLRRH
jgi:hypothetical protein